MNSPSSTNDIRGSGYSAVNALRNTNNEKSIIDPNNNNNTNRILNREDDPGQIAPNDAKNWVASNAWVNTVNKRTLTLGPHWDQLQNSLTTIIKQFTDQKVKKNVSTIYIYIYIYISRYFLKNKNNYKSIFMQVCLYCIYA